MPWADLEHGDSLALAEQVRHVVLERQQHPVLKDLAAGWFRVN